MARNLLYRVIVAVFGIPALIYICLRGGYFLLGSGILLVGIGGYELNAMMRSRGYRTNLFFSILLPVVILLAVFYDFRLADILVLSLIIHTVLAVYDYTRFGKTDLSRFLAEMFGRLLPVFYLGLLASYMISLGKIPELGGLLLIFAFVLVWTIDTFAYFGGITTGKHKLSLTLSPGKTWEGFFFGVGGAIIVGILSKLLYLDISWAMVIVMSAAVGIFGQLGDLFESAIKRHCQVKDSSAILPGHGGVLDRFDSFLFAVPVIYLIFSCWR